eukprot:m.97719 g.97719  ORF g.97719 m.97719 type:complete len:113 (-) comp22059_c0_seq1:38-376(-)
MSLNDLLHKLQSDATTQLWLLRVFGSLLMWLACALVASPLTALVSWIPIVRNLVGGAVAIVSFVFALVLATLVIAVSWIWFHPLVGWGLVALAAAFLFLSSSAATTMKSKNV